MGVKHRLLAILLASTAFVAASALPSAGQDAAWKPAPPTNVFSNGANWSTGTVPTGVATFDQSNRTQLIVTTTSVTLDTFVFNAGAPTYQFFTFSPGSLTLGGLGIVNNSSATPIFRIGGDLTFDNSASAANSFISGEGGTITFSGNSTAANASIQLDSLLQFFGSSDGDNARILTFSGATVDFSGTAGVGNNNIVHAASIAGFGNFSLGANQLIVGTTSTYAEVSGIIDGVGGSLAKIGTGTLTLSGANTYTGGTTVTVGTLVANHNDGSGAVAGTGRIDALGTGAVTLDGGKLETRVSGWLSQDITFNANKTSILAAAVNTTLTIGGDAGVPGDTSTSSTGNLATRIILGANSVAQFGSTIDPGTIQIGMSSAIDPLDIDPSSRIVVAGGTLRDLQDQLWFLTGVASSVTVNAGATIDFNGSNAQIINNLGGNGNVIIGSNSASLLQLAITPGTTQTFGGVISGAGGIIVAAIGGTGTMIFTGTNTYTGGTDVCDCTTLQLGNGGTTGSIVGNVVLGGTLAFNRSNTYIFNGVIADDPFAFSGGQVQHNGTGTTALTANNTYTGGTTVNAGLLVIGNGGTTGSIAGNVVVNGGAFGVNRSDIYTLPNTISGNGGFAQLGTGTTIFNTAQTYLGTTTISFGGFQIGGGAGTLQIGDGGTGGSIASTAIVNNGTLAFNKTNALAIGATISGFGGLNQIGSGTTTLNAATTYLGVTNVTAGILRAGAANIFSASSAFNVGASGTLNLSGFNQSIGSLAGSGAVTLAAATLTTGGNNTSTTYSGTIAGAGGVTKAGTGNFTYSGTSTYTGATTVNGGTLSINGSILSSSGVTVNSGGILGGTGTLPGTTINAGGTLAPGNSIGTITVNGNLTFTGGATYAVEVSPSTSDRTNVTGTATLSGATVTANISAGTVNKQYTILNAAGGITGGFNSTVSTNQPNFVANLSYDTNNTYLNFGLTFGFGSSGGLSQNQQNIGNALTNYFNANGGIPALYGTLTSNGLTQTAGEPGANIPQAGFAAMGQFINAMMDSSGGNGAPGGGLGFAEENAYAPKRKLSPQQTDAYAAVTPRDRMPTPFASRWNVWASGYGGNSTINGDATAGSHATSTRVYGTAVGADYRATPDTRLGFALGGAGTSFTVDSALGGGRADVFQAGAYAKHTMGAAYVAGALAYAWQDVTTDRTVTVSGIDKLRAQLKANALSARLEGGWRTALVPVAVTPYAALQSTAFYLPSYAETATSGSNQFALGYGSKTVTATRAELGARFDKAVPVNDALLTLRARTAWAHDWNTDRSAVATFQSLPGATFNVNGAQPSANAALLSAGADIAWGNGWTVAATFDGEFSRTTRGYAGKGSLRYAW